MERLGMELQRFSAGLQQLGEDPDGLAEAVGELSSLRPILVSSALLSMVKEIADELTRFVVPREGSSGIEELCKRVRSIVSQWVPKCVKMDIVSKVAMVVYALSIVAVSTASTLGWGGGSLLMDVGTVVTAFLGGAAILGALLGMNLAILVLPALPIVAIGQCIYLSISNSFFLWTSIALAISMAVAIHRAWLALDTYRRSLLEVLRISNAISRILEELRAKVAEAQRIEEARIAPAERTELEKIYGEELEELLRYSEELRKLK